MIKKTRNKFEERIFKQLKKLNANFKYESEKISYVFSGHYIPDFVINLPSGERMYIETKGYLRPEHKRKMVAVKKLHPAMDIRILFYSYKPKDIRWAEKYKFPWAVEKLPAEWFQ